MSDDLPDRDELLRRLDEASAKGSVTATKLLLEELRRDADNSEPEDPFADLDDTENVTPIRRKRAS